jgi:hypothetical protein
MQQFGDLFELNVKFRCQNVNIKVFRSVSTLRAIWFLESTRISTTKNTNNHKIVMEKQ